MPITWSSYHALLAKSTLVELGTMVKKMARYRLHAAMAMAA